MHAFLTGYASVMSVISRVSMAFCATCLAVLVALTGWMVFGRYVLNDPPTWAENAILILVLFVSACGAGVGVRERLHLQVQLILDHVSPTCRMTFNIAANVMMLLFGLVMVHGGWMASAQVWPYPDAMLPISRGLYYVPMVVTGILITLFEIEILLELLTGAKTSADGEMA